MNELQGFSLPTAAFAVACALTIVAVLGGCAHDRVVLLPNQDGHASRLEVTHGKKSTTLTQAYEQVEVSGSGTARTSVTNAAEVEKNYRDVINALPKRPVTYALYFLEGSNELTEESKQIANQVLAEIAKTVLAEVVIIGHTDTTGTSDRNDDLSLDRANVVRDKLVGLGVDKAHIQVAGRGERELMLKTPDETAEPRNRRVEIDVR